MKKFCYVCGKEQDTKIITKEEVSIIRGEEIKSESHIRICSFCKEELFDEELDEENIQRTYDIYRKKYGILSPDEIKEVREQYGLSQRLFAKLLNIGEASIARYETGALPEKSLSNMIMLLKEPRNMKLLLYKNAEVLNHKEKYKLIQKINDLISQGECATSDEIDSHQLYILLKNNAKKEGKSIKAYIEEIIKKDVV
ncbi:putative zinc finger/helix-turn-helix protein,YgiT family [Tepidanaerobacter acetatoxydans Re1]|uniref:Putative zinc finger/helix-turn-helix protein,YgiT family n=1 Tax=Tepidanaerobacter acetatoxydans (strain DSM 21804 / JCM 16047 / Re1) TaxID=1209989 RepID=F4LT64_TEPAE|nr:type II TA system antitoxin MqsA family protein [Tepidanaerobacter acetatoxydans]AEE92464.1 putative zinc finger/helix-turn-helix protein, YgiT family [Tepidanaerobacter acetatoxydans Re1]CCP27390.1 putative zinc finger/helix-turn-helix protein,YgiT family [Tepidanaerobacter acetatoxydans Re1]